MKTVVILFLLIFVSCSSKEKIMDINNEGQKLYYDKCSGCHRLYKKAEYKSNRWKEIMNLMKKKSHLTDDEERMIIKYLAE
jgi:uncharacterized ParB-like nuclease family protein